MKQNLLILFMKSPWSQQAKTRLVADLGTDMAQRISVTLAQNCLNATKSNAMWDRQIHYEAGGYSGRDIFSLDDKIIPQNGKSMGERLNNAFFRGFVEGYKRIVLVGSDIPDLSKTHISQAFHSLIKKSVVIGPSVDGGYWLIGSRKDSYDLLFNKIAWSSKNVLEQTVNQIKQMKKSWEFSPILQDLDTGVDCYRRIAQRGSLKVFPFTELIAEQQLMLLSGYSAWQKNNINEHPIHQAYISHNVG
jgi:uncharacterized protein